MTLDDATRAPDLRGVQETSPYRKITYGTVRGTLQSTLVQDSVPGTMCSRILFPRSATTGDTVNEDHLVGLAWPKLF